MSSREAILNSIRGIHRDLKPLPDVPSFGIKSDLVKDFTTSLIGNKAEVMDSSAFEFWLKSSGMNRVFSAIPEYKSYSTVTLPKDPHDLENLELAILEGQFGVAENGAIWLDDNQLPHRAMPFITEHLVLIVPKGHLVENMHQAYQKIGKDHAGFGLFIAGPSKTADIEQSLVIGAHGAKSLRVVLV
ncbi:LutC/YkgG family protein [Algoriphagus confluentis]|uniref:LUD domain-containing protein n=1 Tax=Algoriphagus confluentis TaxID=1697556 RepID=A0ABQ6PQP0_9BACT|nr:LUD domain-containing protein [Algoriphagus confluentis]